MLCSCAERKSGEEVSPYEGLMTEYSTNRTITATENGKKKYEFFTPLLEGYTAGKEPYREFRKGVRISTYKADSANVVDVTLTANYAIYYEKRELWEAKGNVVVEKSDGRTLYTQQLFWNARTKKVYSNVDSKIVQNEGRDVFFGEGFESDEDFKDWRFRRNKIRMEVEAAPRDPADTARRAGAAERPRREEPRGDRTDGGAPREQRPLPRRSEEAASRPSDLRPQERMEVQAGRLESFEAEAAVRTDMVE